MVLFGAFILNTCSKWEKNEKEIASDPRSRIGKKKLDIDKPKTMRGNIMTTVGTLLCLGGMILFLMHIKL